MSEKQKIDKKQFKKANISIATVGDDLITFKETNVVKVEILEIKDGKTTINGKLREQYEMTVIDLVDDKQKKFNTASARLRKALSDINQSEGIIGQKLRIEKVGIGTATTYVITKIV